MATLSTTNLMLVIKATNDAAKVLKSVEGHLQEIVTHPRPPGFRIKSGMTDKRGTLSP